MTDETTRSDPTGEAQMRQDVTALIPCYDAGSHISGVVDRVGTVVDHIVLVDDGSTDGALDALGDGPWRVVRFPENRGKGHAIMAGFKAALERPEMQCAITLDADGQHDPVEIPGLYAAFRDGHADFAIGSRSFSGKDVPLRSWLGNTLTALLTKILLGKRIGDTQSGYRLHSRAYVEDIIKTVTPGRYETEMEILVKAVRGDYGVALVPIKTIYEEGNPTSHFNKLRDSWLIYRRLFVASLGRR
jgi:glycosyltransferase involved in cell wall biosynthesis